MTRCYILYMSLLQSLGCFYLWQPAILSDPTCTCLLFYSPGHHVQLRVWWWGSGPWSPRHRPLSSWGHPPAGPGWSIIIILINIIINITTITILTIIYITIIILIITIITMLIIIPGWSTSTPSLRGRGSWCCWRWSHPPSAPQHWRRWPRPIRRGEYFVEEKYVFLEPILSKMFPWIPIHP